MTPLSTQNSRVPIYCDDCGREKLAEVRDGKLVIADRRHGQRHVAVIPTDPPAIHRYYTVTLTRHAETRPYSR